MKKTKVKLPTMIYTFVCPKCWIGIEFTVYGEAQHGKFRILKKEKFKVT